LRSVPPPPLSRAFSDKYHGALGRAGPFSMAVAEARRFFFFLLVFSSPRHPGVSRPFYPPLPRSPARYAPCGNLRPALFFFFAVPSPGRAVARHTLFFSPDGTISSRFLFFLTHEVPFLFSIFCFFCSFFAPRRDRRDFFFFHLFTREYRLTPSPLRRIARRHSVSNALLFSLFHLLRKALVKLPPPKDQHHLPLAGSRYDLLLSSNTVQPPSLPFENARFFFYIWRRRSRVRFFQA